MQQLRYAIVTAATLLLLASPGGSVEVSDAPADSSEAASDAVPMRWLDTELFSVEIPVSWKELDEAKLAASRAEAERIAREIFPPEISASSPLDRVQWFNAFESEDKSTLLMLLISEVPPPIGSGRAYVEGKVLGYADWQRSQKAVDTVRLSETQELNGMPAVEVGLDLPDGATVHTVHLWTAVYRDRIGSVVAVTNAGALMQMRQLLLQLLGTIKPSKEVAASQRSAGFRNWLRGKVWIYEGRAPAEALVLRIIVVLATFSICFALSLRLLYEAILVWYRWRKLEDRALEAARRAARDVLHLGYFYSERLTLTCALFSMTLTTAAVAWLAAVP
jgi:hypothetical protein